MIARDVLSRAARWDFVVIRRPGGLYAERINRGEECDTPAQSFTPYRVVLRSHFLRVGPISLSLISAGLLCEFLKILLLQFCSRSTSSLPKLLGEFPGAPGAFLPAIGVYSLPSSSIPRREARSRQRGLFTTVHLGLQCLSGSTIPSSATS